MAVEIRNRLEVWPDRQGFLQAKEKTFLGVTVAIIRRFRDEILEITRDDTNLILAWGVIKVAEKALGYNM